MSSSAQDAQRLIFKTVAARWNTTLTEAQRRAWNEFTNQYPRQDALAQKYCMSGQNRHASCNAISYAYAGTYLNNPPTSLNCSTPSNLLIQTASHSPQALTIQMLGNLNPAEYWVLAATPLTNPGRYNAARLWRPLCFGNSPLPYTKDAITEYTAIFSALTLGYKLQIKLQIANTLTGTISTALTASAIVT